MIRAALLAAAILAHSAALADGLPSVRLLPLHLANAAAMEAVAACERGGFAVTATVLDASGLVKAVARGDGAPPHSLETSRAKAFGLVTFGPGFREMLGGALAERMLAKHEDGQARGISGLLIAPGAVLLKSGPDVIGAIGVGGAPDSARDEACAWAGFASISDRLKP